MDERDPVLMTNIIVQEARNFRAPRPGIGQKQVDPVMMVLEDQGAFCMAAPFAFADRGRTCRDGAGGRPSPSAGRSNR